MIITKMAISRRTVLRGLGTSLALPFLDAMVLRRAYGAMPEPMRATLAVQMMAEAMSVNPFALPLVLAAIDAAAEPSVAVAALDATHRRGRRDLPMAVGMRAEQRREECGRVETRRAQPVDGTVVADEGTTAGVPDHGVVFDAKCHSTRS